MSVLGWLVGSSGEVPADDGWLSPHERARLARMRVPKRAADFRLGRWTAKRAIRAMAERADPLRTKYQTKPNDIDVRAAEDGAPEVFLPEGPAPWAISLAHSGGHALAVVGDRGAVFGADLETIELRSAAFLEDYLVAYERAWVEAHEEPARAAAATLVWSVKEAVLKALRTGLREDTRAVETLPGTAPFFPAPPATWRPLGAIVRGRGLIFEGFAMEREGQILTILARDGVPDLFALGP